MIYEEITKFIKQNQDEIFCILKDLCNIPAPSHFEYVRAQYCKKYLENIGAEGVYIDEALNTVFPINCEESHNITVFAAHTDTVFPDTEPMPYLDDGEKIYSPAVADDTAGVVVLLLMAKYFIENRIVPKDGIMFVCNSCEEGLGNLKGMRKLFDDFEGRIKQFITLDSNLDMVNDVCVGSHRYEVEIITQGGHSYEAFGNKNAISIASGIVSEIYKINVPQKDGVKTTYNVGTFSGGTSVNTIAQDAKFLCEYRSDDIECLFYMEKEFARIFDSAKSEDTQIKITRVGERPCADIDREKIEKLKELVVPEIEKVIGKKVSFKSGSTDCNIPLSKGIPALCIGSNMHEGIHTREEWVDKKSILQGLQIAISVGLKLI